jgi:ppGpp synthetase/RelA/SpoT-type nucleotidyltranferase
MDEILVSRIAGQYKDKLQLYHDFTITMETLLICLLDNNGYKYQISHRLKSIDSLRNKISRKAGKGTQYRALSDITDLAGIRIVFYFESDKEEFIHDLYKELTPRNLELVEHSKKNGYHATHIIAQFGEKRLALAEYSRYAGLKCEIQLTSALYHAWSEIEHGIFYKPDKEVQNLDQEVVVKLKKELEKAMTNYIEKASAIIEHVAVCVKSINSEQDGKGDDNYKKNLVVRNLKGEASGDNA